jgi:hypothetical protein
MERRMLIGLKQVAETGMRSRIDNAVHIVLWAIVFTLFGVAIIRTVLQERWIPQLAGVMAAGTVFQILTLVQPPVVVGFLLVYAVVAVMGWVPVRYYRSVGRPRSHARAA